MSFYRKILPSAEKLKEIRDKFETDEEFVSHIHRGADAMEGSPESFKFLREIEERIKSKINKDNEAQA